MVDPSSGRATLLESIRQAGGIGKAKLRSVKERKLEKKKQKEREQGETALATPSPPVPAPILLPACTVGSFLGWEPTWLKLRPRGPLLSPPGGAQVQGYSVGQMTKGKVIPTLTGLWRLQVV